MGQYLVIGIATRLCISKEKARSRASATPEQIAEAMQKYFNQGGIYRLEEDENYISLKLDPAIAEEEMIGFLEDFYSLRYAGDRIPADMDEIRKRNSLDEWIELAEQKHHEAFQMDKYGWVYTPFPGGWPGYLTTSADLILLSINGKIIMETYGTLFDFLTNLIRERLSRYRLADSLQICISG